MRRPAEYDNLVRAGYFHDQPATPGYLEQYLITDAHLRRNETVYRAPLPPVSLAEARAMIRILEGSLPLAKKLTGSP